MQAFFHRESCGRAQKLGMARAAQEADEWSGDDIRFHQRKPGMSDESGPGRETFLTFLSYCGLSWPEVIVFVFCKRRSTSRTKRRRLNLSMCQVEKGKKPMITKGNG